MSTTTTQPANAWGGAEALSVSPDDLAPDPNNPRKNLGDLTELANSLRGPLGMLQPVLAIPNPLLAEGPYDGGMSIMRYQIVAGHRRVAAAIQAGLTEVPVLVRANLAEHASALEAQLVENLLREDLDPLEEAETMQRLLDDFGLTQTQLAKRVGLNQSTVSRRLALRKLSEPARAALSTGALDRDRAATIARMPEEVQNAVAIDLSKGVAPAEAIAKAEHKAQANRVAAEEQRQVDGAVSALEAANVAVVDWPPMGHWSNREDAPLVGDAGHALQRGVTYPGRRGSVPVEPIDHQGQPCHGATVNPRDAQVVYVCLDPTRHGFPTLDELDAQAEAERAVALAESDRRSRMLAAYEASMERLPKAKIPKGAIIDFVLLAVTRLMDDYMADVVEMLGIKRAADAPSYMSLEEADHLLHVALEDHPVERVALAVCMAWTTATSDETSHGDEVSYALEQLLRTYGGLAAELEAITAESNQEGNAPATLALDEPTDAEMVAQAVETGATVDLLPEGATVEMADTAEALEVIDAAMTPLGPGRRRGGVDAGQAPGDAEAAALPTRCAGSGAALLASGKAGRRADCPVCGQSVSVTLAGAARSHG